MSEVRIREITTKEAQKISKTGDSEVTRAMRQYFESMADGSYEGTISAFGDETPYSGDAGDETE